MIEADHCSSLPLRLRMMHGQSDGLSSSHQTSLYYGIPDAASFSAVRSIHLLVMMIDEEHGERSEICHYFGFLLGSRHIFGIHVMLLALTSGLEKQGSKAKRSKDDEVRIIIIHHLHHPSSTIAYSTRFH